MTLDAFKTLLFEHAKAAGFTDWELYYAESQGFEVTMFEREMDNYQVTGSSGVCFRGLYNGRMGYASAEILDEDSVKMLVNAALENAKTLETSDVPEIYDGSGTYTTLPLFNPSLQDWQAADKIAAASEMEELLYAQPYMVSDLTEVSTSQSMRRIMNSKGLDVSYRANNCFFMAEAIVEKDGKFGLIDKAGAVVIPIEYDELHRSAYKPTNELLWGMKDGAEYCYNIAGEAI